MSDSLKPYRVAVKRFIPRGRASGHYVGEFAVLATAPELAAETAERDAQAREGGDLSQYFAYRITAA